MSMQRCLDTYATKPNTVGFVCVWIDEVRQ